MSMPDTASDTTLLVKNADLVVTMDKNRREITHSDGPEDWVTTREVLWIATRGGARALGRGDIGSIEPGMAADLAVFDLTKIDMAGHQDPVVFLTASCGYTKATIVNGRIVVRDGRLLTVDQDEVARNANEWARRLVPR